MYITCKEQVQSTKARIQITYRTGLSSWTDIAGAILEVPVGDYNALDTYDIILPNDAELGARLLGNSGDLDTCNLRVQIKYLGPS